MLQAPPQVSRVCGHGHIKKFWLMQTQKESQSSDSVVAVSSPSPPRNVNIGYSAAKSVDLRSSPTHSSCGEQPTGKHSSMSCAESLSPQKQIYTTSTRMSMDGDNEVCAQRNRGSPEHFTSRLSEDNSSSPSQSISSKSSTEPDSKQRGSNGSSVQSEKDAYASSNPSFKRSCGDNRHQITYSDNMEKFAEGKHGSSFKKPSVVLPDNGHQDASCENSPNIADPLQNPSPKACSLCGTTKTPMWRSGPQGPKSLCNACGIRFKKYRSFPGQSETSELMMHSVGGSRYVARQLKRKQGSALPYESCKSDIMDIKSPVQEFDPRHQKKSKLQDLIKREQIDLKQALTRDTSSSTWKLSSGPPSFKKIYGCVLPLHSKLKKLVPMDEHRNSAFAKDEEEAAVLLMHLSCGLVY